MLGGFKRTTREFKYTPVYWDKEKEEREARRRATLANIESKDAEKDYVPGSYIRSSSIKRMRSANRENSKSRVGLYRTAIFIALVFAVMYIMTDFFELV